MLYYNSFFDLSTGKLHFLKIFLDFFAGKLYIISGHIIVEKGENSMLDLGNKEVMSKNLKRLMKERNVTAKKLSKDLNFPYTTLLSWLKAEYYPRIDKIEAMADYFGVLKSELIESQTAEQEKPIIDDGLTDGQRQLIEFARSLTEEQAALALRLLRSLVEAD